MDVQASDTGFRPDPAVTAVVPAAGNIGQGVLFHEALGYPTFGDTDKIPAVSGARGGRRGGGGPRAPGWLRLAVLIVIVAILAAAATLGLVKAGVIDGNGNSGNPAASGSPTNTSATHASRPNAATSKTKSLLTATGTSASGAESYTVHAHVFGVTVTTSVGRSWVEIGAVGQNPTFAGIVPADSSQKEILLAPAQVQVGAGGTKVVISSGGRSQTLTPPSAPFSYQITPV
jgi:hypothetical protein